MTHYIYMIRSLCLVALCAMLALPVSADETVLTAPGEERPLAGEPAEVKPAEVKPVDGKYVFVPDSMVSQVIKLLDGHSKVVDDEDRLDPREKTVYRGDTVPMVLRSLNLGRYDRRLFNYLYVPKGVMSIGLTASYGEIGMEDLDAFGLVSDVNINARMLSVKPYLQYFIKNNMAVGVKFGFYNGRGAIGSLNAEVMDDMNFNLHDIIYKSKSFSAALTFTQYLGLVRLGSIGLFNELELAYIGGKTDFQRPYAGELKLTHTVTNEVQLNFSPGIQVFVMKNVAFHVSLGAFGFYFKNEKQEENSESKGDRFSSGANFRLNLFNINFGLGLNF